MKNKTKKISAFTITLILLSIPLFFAHADIMGTFAPDNNDSGLSDVRVKYILSGVMNWFLMILTVLAVISFIISGFLFITAGSNSAQVEKAKTWLIYAIIGTVVSLSGYIVLNFIDTTLKGNVQT